MGRHKDIGDLLLRILPLEQNIEEVKSIVLTQRDFPFEVCGEVYQCSKNTLYFRRVSSKEEDFKELADKIIKGDLSDKLLNKIKRYVIEDRKLVQHKQSRINRADFLLDKINWMRKKRKHSIQFYNTFMMVLRDSSIMIRPNKLKNYKYLADFHVHPNGAGPSPADFKLSDENIVISYRLKNKSTLCYCNIYYIHEHKERKLITFSGRVKEDFS